jgi:hypothetical protein
MAWNLEHSLDRATGTVLPGSVGDGYAKDINKFLSRASLNAYGLFPAVSLQSEMFPCPIPKTS